jgi:hypothetical protein
MTKRNSESEKENKGKIWSLFLGFASLGLIYAGVTEMNKPQAERENVSVVEGTIRTAFPDSIKTHRRRSFGQAYRRFVTFRLETSNGIFRYYQDQPDYVKVRNALLDRGEVKLAFEYEKSDGCLRALEIVKGGDTLVSFDRASRAGINGHIPMILIGSLLAIVALCWLLYEFAMDREKNAAKRN